MMRFLIRFLLVIVFFYIAYVFAFRGQGATYFDYFLLFATVTLALYFDGKDLDKRLGTKTSFLGAFQFCGQIFKAGFLALFQRIRKK
jgi:hypothetical protein